MSGNGMATGEVQEEKANVFLGIIGGLAGAVLGAVLWVVLYENGIIASIAGIAIIYLSCKGYALLSKSKRLQGVIICIIISGIVLIASHFICWGLDIYHELKDYGDVTLIDSILMVPEIAFTEDVIIGFLRDLGIGLVLIGVGAAPMIRQAREQ